MSTTRLLILGVVRWLQPVHGYDVRRELLSWNADQWANVAPGSVYHALKKLAAEGLLAEVRTERQGSRPARTTYEITAKGEVDFQELLRKYWWEYHERTDPFQAALGFLPNLPRPEAVAALRNRARVLRGMADGLATSMASGWMDDVKPPHVQQMLKLHVARLRVEADWCDETADLVAAGRLETGVHSLGELSTGPLPEAGP